MEKSEILLVMGMEKFVYPTVGEKQFLHRYGYDKFVYCIVGEKSSVVPLPMEKSVIPYTMHIFVIPYTTRNYRTMHYHKLVFSYCALWRKPICDSAGYGENQFVIV